MHKCRVKAKCFHGGKLLKEGAVVDFDGNVKDIPKHFERLEEKPQKEQAKKD